MFTKNNINYRTKTMTTNPPSMIIIYNRVNLRRTICQLTYRNKATILQRLSFSYIVMAFAVCDVSMVGASVTIPKIVDDIV